MQAQRAVTWAPRSCLREIRLVQGRRRFFETALVRGNGGNHVHPCQRAVFEAAEIGRRGVSAKVSHIGAGLTTPRWLRMEREVVGRTGRKQSARPTAIRC